jgi:hypothetical protein
MEPTYTILGTDGNQYGPVTADQFKAWAREGRVGGETQVWRSDQPSWMAAAALPELGLPAGATAALPMTAPAMGLPINPDEVAALDPDLEKRMKSGAGWFYWIAGFSIINSILILTGQEWGFALGLGVTSIIDAIAAGVETGAARIVAIVMDLLAAGLVVLFGFFASKGHGWAFIIGMVLLALDTALTGLLQMWMSLALHVFALFCIFSGYKASRQLRA